MGFRFAIGLASSQLAERFQAEEAAVIAPSWNVRPGQNALAVRRLAQSQICQLDFLCWGLMPNHVQSGRQRNRLTAISADQVTVSRMTKTAFTSQRCLVPATAYYEMTARPQAVDTADGMMIAMAAVWDRWRNPVNQAWHDGFAIITRRQSDPAATPAPLTIRQQDWPLWLGQETGSARWLLHTADDLKWRRWAVSRRILNSDDDDPGLLAAFPAVA